MLRTDSMSNVMAQITRQIASAGGCVTEEMMAHVLVGFGITRQKRDYKTKLVEYGYLIYDRAEGTYCLTEESRIGAEITITVKPSLYAEEVRRHLVGMLAGYAGLIEISDVEL